MEIISFHCVELGFGFGLAIAYIQFEQAWLSQLYIQTDPLHSYLLMCLYKYIMDPRKYAQNNHMHGGCMQGDSDV